MRSNPLNDSAPLFSCKTALCVRSSSLATHICRLLIHRRVWCWPALRRWWRCWRRSEHGATHTHMHTHSLSVSLSRTHTNPQHTHTHPLSLSLTHTDTHAHTHTHTHTHRWWRCCGRWRRREHGAPPPHPPRPPRHPLHPLHRLHFLKPHPRHPQLHTRDDTLNSLNRCIAFAMGLRERLGAGSLVRALDPEVVRMVLDQV